MKQEKENPLQKVVKGVHIVVIVKVNMKKETGNKGDNQAVKIIAIDYQITLEKDQEAIISKEFLAGHLQK